MNWFGRKAAQHPARPALSRVYGNWSAPAPLSYEAQLREGYLGNAIVQRAVRLVAEAAGSAPLVASDPALVALVSATSGGRGWSRRSRRSCCSMAMAMCRYWPMARGRRPSCLRCGPSG